MDITIQHALMDKSFELVNIGIDGGTIVTLTRDPLSPGKMDLDAQGQLVVPPFFEPHFHLDNPFLWGEINQSGTLREAIEIYARVKKDRDLNDLVQRATEALRESLSYGVLWFRTNVDIDPVAQLRLLRE